MGVVKGVINATRRSAALLHPVRGRDVRHGLEAREGRDEHVRLRDDGRADAVLPVGAFDANFQLIIGKPDNVPIVGLIFSLLFLTWYAMREAVRNDQRIAAGKGPIEKEESDRVWVWPDLVYTELISLVLCSVILIVWSIVLQGAARAAGEPVGDAQSVEGAVVLPRPAGDARLLRSVAGRRRAAGPDHRRADRDPVHRQEPEGQRLLHVQRAQGRDRHLPVRVRDSLGRRSSCSGTFLRGPNWNFFGPFEFWDIHKLEALVNVNLVGVHLGARAANRAAGELVPARDLRDSVRA